MTSNKKPFGYPPLGPKRDLAELYKKIRSLHPDMTARCFLHIELVASLTRPQRLIYDVIKNDGWWTVPEIVAEIPEFIDWRAVSSALPHLVRYGLAAKSATNEGWAWTGLDYADEYKEAQ